MNTRIFHDSDKTIVTVMNIVIQLNILSEDEVDFKGGNSVFQLLLGSFYHCKNCIVNGVLWY